MVLHFEVPQMEEVGVNIQVQPKIRLGDLRWYCSIRLLVIVNTGLKGVNVENILSSIALCAASLN